MKRGLLRNPLYAGKMVWNRSRWLLDPDSKVHKCRVRPEEEWVETDVPELRILPQKLWEQAQARLALHDVTRSSGRHNIGKYLLSGFVRCGICGGSFSKVNRSFRCANHRNRGEAVCPNSKGVKAEKLERIVIAALRERLFAPRNLKVIIERVRDELLARAKQEARSVRPNDRAKELRAVETEIEHIKNAVKTGKATESLLEMLDDAERRRKELFTGQKIPKRDDTPARLERVLAELPERVQAYLEDLESLLARDQVERGKDILAALGTEVVISPDGTAEIRGSLQGVLSLVSKGKADCMSVAGAGGIFRTYTPLSVRVKVAA